MLLNEKKVFDFLNITNIPDFPLYIMVETTARCNAKCPSCLHGTGEMQRNHFIMKDDVKEKVFSEIKKFASKIRRVAPYFNGEPLLDKKIYDSIRFISDLGIKEITITTNGSLLDKNAVSKLYDSGLTMLDISMSAFSKDVYEKVHLGLKYDVAIKNIHNAIDFIHSKDRELRIRISFVILENNKHEYKAHIQYWKKVLRPCDSIIVKNYHDWDYRKRPSSLTDSCQAERELPCHFPFGTVIINSDGNVLLCGKTPNNLYVLGNVMESSIYDIWNCGEFKKIRDIHITKGFKSYLPCERLCKNSCINQKFDEVYGEKI